MHTRRCILTIDVDSGSGRAILFDHCGRQLSEARREWLPEPVPGHPGALRFDTDKARRLLAECVRETIRLTDANPRDIEGVTATSMREGMVLYDADKRAILECPNVDARAAEEVKEMVLQGLAEPVYRTGGNWLTITSPVRFRWIRKNMPDLWCRIAFMNMLSDWVLFRLSGNIVTEPSCGSSSGIFDLSTRSWSRDLIELIDLPRGSYPPVCESGTIIGRVTAEARFESRNGRLPVHAIRRVDRHDIEPSALNHVHEVGESQVKTIIFLCRRPGQCILPGAWTLRALLWKNQSSASPSVTRQGWGRKSR